MSYWPFLEVPGKKKIITKKNLQKSDEITMVSELTVLAQKGGEKAPQKKVSLVFLVFANNPIVFSGGVGRGKICGFGCGVSDM